MPVIQASLRPDSTFAQGTRTGWLFDPKTMQAFIDTPVSGSAAPHLFSSVQIMRFLALRPSVRVYSCRRP